MFVYFDCEFTGLTKDTTLVSIGLLTSQNQYTREYHMFYAEFTDYDKTYDDKWFMDNVVKNLVFQDEEEGFEMHHAHSFGMKGTKEQVKEKLLKWFDKVSEGESDITLVTDVGHYDMVLFIDIFGSAFDLPKKIVPTYIDINNIIADEMGLSLQEAFDLNREELVKQLSNDSEEYDRKHNSLWDASIIKRIYEDAYKLHNLK